MNNPARATRNPSERLMRLMANVVATFLFVCRVLFLIHAPALPSVRFLGFRSGKIARMSGPEHG